MTSVDNLAGNLGDSLTRTGHWTALSGLFQPLLELLATGAPVTAGQLAAATGQDVGQVRDTIASLPGVELDPGGNIVGYGLTQLPTPHRFEVDGRQLYTWCALDTLIFPILIGATAHVTSVCHTTSVPVRLTVEPDAIADVHPGTAVVSIVTPQDMTDVRAAFCHDVHYFASPEAAQPWLTAHPGSTVLPVADAYALARKLAVTLFTDTVRVDDCC